MSCFLCLGHRTCSFIKYCFLCFASSATLGFEAFCTSLGFGPLDLNLRRNLSDNRAGDSTPAHFFREGR